MPQASMRKQSAVKRVMDIVGAGTLLVATAPILLLIAAAIKLEDGGPVFFVQERLGRRGRPFRLVKFRSMVVNAEKLEGGLRIRERDPRITRVGRFIRRTSLDELPELLNILRGEMSLVGPRPALTRDLERYTDVQRRRLDVRPGLTGLAQVSGRAALTWPERIEFDLRYVEHWTLLLDLKILFATIGHVFGGGEEVYPTGDPWADRATDGDGSRAG